MCNLEGRRSTAKIVRFLAAGTAILGMVHVAAARDDSGAREFFTSAASGGGQAAEQPSAPASIPAPTYRPMPSAQPAVSRPASFARSIHMRPLEHAAHRHVPAAPPAERPLTVKLHRPKAGTPTRLALAPTRPGKVSIFEDKTLRRGDAVMTAKGIRIFAGSTSWPYQDKDFVALADARKMDKSMEKILLDLDRLPRG